MSTRTTLLVSNHWHRPGITMTVVQDAESPKGAIHLETELEDFRKGVLAEFPHPTTLWTATALDAALTEAFSKALEKVKAVTVGAM